MRGSTQGAGGLITVFLRKATEETLAFLNLSTIAHTAASTYVLHTGTHIQTVVENNKIHLFKYCTHVWFEIFLFSAAPTHFRGICCILPATYIGVTATVKIYFGD